MDENERFKVANWTRDEFFVGMDLEDLEDYLEANAGDHIDVAPLAPQNARIAA
jgi:hypothetical protein